MPRNALAKLVAAMLLCVASPVSAKRAAPAEVTAVARDGVEYRVPLAADRQGYIDAYDAKTKHRLWSRQIYVVVQDPNLESDVQDVFITSTKLDGHALQIGNEKGCEYRLDLDSLEVKVIKGSILVRR